MGCPNKRAAKRATVYGMIDSSSFAIENFAKKFAEKSLLHLYKEFIITATDCECPFYFRAKEGKLLCMVKSKITN